MARMNNHITPQSVTPAPSERLIRSLRAAHTFGRLDNGLRALPAVGFDVIRADKPYRNLEKAQRMAQEAETMRQTALRELAETLLEPGDGWTEEQVLHALDNPLSS